MMLEYSTIPSMALLNDGDKIKDRKMTSADECCQLDSSI